MPPRTPEFLSLLEALNVEEVRYVVIGGIAMVLHGASSVTQDIDLAISIQDDNASAIVKALAPFRPYPPPYKSADMFVWDERSIFGAVIALITDAGHLDLLRIYPGIDNFEDLWSRSEIRTIGDLTIHVASLDDLILMKQTADRPKDREHLQQLLALKEMPGF